MILSGHQIILKFISLENTQQFKKAHLAIASRGKYVFDFLYSPYTVYKLYKCHTEHKNLIH